MSKYTTELRYIDKNDIFDFDFTMYGEDATIQAQHKQEFIDRFYNYYFFDEINGDSVNEFNRWLEHTIDEWLPLFNDLYAKQKDLMSKDLLNKIRNYSGNSNGNYGKILNTSYVNNSTYLDTAQTPIVEGTNYATTKENDTSSKNDAESGNTTTTMQTSETETKELPIEVWKQYYENFKDLDMELIRKFKKCFLLIY